MQSVLGTAKDVLSFASVAAQKQVLLRSRTGFQPIRRAVPGPLWELGFRVYIYWRPCSGVADCLSMIEGQSPCNLSSGRQRTSCPLPQSLRKSKFCSAPGPAFSRSGGPSLARFGSSASGFTYIGDLVSGSLIVFPWLKGRALAICPRDGKGRPVLCLSRYAKASFAPLPDRLSAGPAGRPWPALGARLPGLHILATLFRGR